MGKNVNIYFSDFFAVDKGILEQEGIFDISLINDLPVFIDPFLIFNSEKQEYKNLHIQIIEYIKFLKDHAHEDINKGILKYCFQFPEVKQNWLGYSLKGNDGAGLGPKFAAALNYNLANIFKNFGNETITKSSHLEKFCLVRQGVGKDNISDLTTNLIKGFLCSYTECFAKKYIDSKYLREILVDKVIFDYKLKRWFPKKFTLPFFSGDYIILSPKDILTKDEAWINKKDLLANFDDILEALPNEVLRAQISSFIAKVTPDNPKKNELDEVVIKTYNEFPELIDYFIKYKEDNGNQAVLSSLNKVKETEEIFIKSVKSLAIKLKQVDFYEHTTDSFDESFQRVLFLKQVIENNDGYRLFYHKGLPIKKESDLQLIFRLTWYATDYDVNSEVNNGRGPVDYKISKGLDKTLVEFKLASNSKLKQNLENQVKVYEEANKTKKSIKVILFFEDEELQKLQRIFKDLEVFDLKEANIVLIDARDNKLSASNVKSSPN